MVPVPNVPRPRSGNDTPLHIHLPGDWLDEAQKLATEMSEPGLEYTRADVIRRALKRGLDELRHDLATAKRRR